MSDVIIRSKPFIRVLEILVPLLSWTLITFPLWFSPFHPALVAYFIIFFDLYFFYKSTSTAYNAVLSYKEIKISISDKLPPGCPSFSFINN